MAKPHNVDKYHTDRIGQVPDVHPTNFQNRNPLRAPNKANPSFIDIDLFLIVMNYKF